MNNIDSNNTVDSTSKYPSLVEQYQSAFCELQQLCDIDQGEYEIADRLREKMDLIWFKLSDDELKQINYGKPK